MKGISLIALLFLAGCATTSQQSRIALTGDIMQDGPRMIAEGPAKDKVLWQYRTAAAAMRQGKFDEAKALLDDALLTLGGIYGLDSEARKSRRLFQKESRKTFIGEPYERSMAYFYRGVLYWMDGELDNARACFRSAEFEDSDAENKEYAGDWVLPDYLDGLATAKLAGDGSDAFQRAEANSSGDFGRRHVKLPAYDPNANLLFIIEFGPGPLKYGGGEYGEQLRIRTRPSPIVSARIKTGSIDLPVAATDDLNFQATTRGGRVMDHVLGNKAVFKSTTDTVGDAALVGGLTTAAVSDNRTTQNVGLGIALAGLATKLVSAATTPEADTRTWDNLPHFITFATATLPAGEHQVIVEFQDANGKSEPNLTKTLTVTVPVEGDKVIFVSDSSITPQCL